MRTRLANNARLVVFVALALLAVATACNDAVTDEVKPEEPASNCAPDDETCQANCEEGCDDCAASEEGCAAECDPADEDCATECDAGDDGCDPEPCEDADCPFNQDLDAHNRLFDLSDMPSEFSWLTLTNEIGTDGVCNGAGFAEIAAPEDLAAGAFRGPGGQIIDEVYDYDTPEDAELVVDTTREQATCGSWPSDDGSRIFTVEVVEGAGFDEEAVADELRLGYTVAPASGQPPYYVSQVIFAAEDVVVGFSGFGTDPATAAALVDDFLPELFERSLRGEPQCAEEAPLAEWTAHRLPGWQATRAQMTQIQYGGTLETHAAGLEQLTYILDDQAFLLERCGHPTGSEQVLDELVGLLDTQGVVLDGQIAAERAGDRPAADAKAAEYTANVALIKERTTALNLVDN